MVSQADPRPEGPATGAVVEGCYAGSLSDCGGVIEGEHFVSHRLLKVLGAGKPLKVRGIDPKDQERECLVSPRNLTARVLCSRHNRSLKPIDNAGNRFFETLASAGIWLEDHPAGTEHRVATSGHDLERWCLKALCGFIARAGKPVPELWQRILFGRCALLPPRGLYAYAEVGDEIAGKGVSLEEVRLVGSTSIGVVVRLLNHELVLSMSPGVPVTLTRQTNKSRMLRPGSIVLENGGNGSTRTIFLSWHDSLQHASIRTTWTARPNDG
ncbi:MAG TPA: hypothetical protein PLR99_27675 [Polyangiaceae bacterium]|nr:hypothetical protein [Polyangiaceae bacterium]